MSGGGPISGLWGKGPLPGLPGRVPCRRVILWQSFLWCVLLMRYEWMKEFSRLLVAANSTIWLIDVSFSKWICSWHGFGGRCACWWFCAVSCRFCFESYATNWHIIHLWLRVSCIIFVYQSFPVSLTCRLEIVFRHNSHVHFMRISHGIRKVVDVSDSHCALHCRTCFRMCLFAFVSFVASIGQHFPKEGPLVYLTFCLCWLYFSLKCFSNREHVSYMVVGVCFDCAMWCLFRSVYQVPVNLFSSRSHKQWCLSFAVLLMLLGGMVPFGPRVCLTMARRTTTMNKCSLPLTWWDGIQRHRVTSRSSNWSKAHKGGCRAWGWPLESH